MLQAEKHETEQERIGNPSRKDMIVRYIKHLVQITTGMSSFYVNVGLNRLLRSYSTSEAQFTYEMLSHRYLGPDEYRRAKAVLMDRIKSRFSKFLKVTRVDHRELRFETCDDQQRWASLVNKCLKAFTPWSTEGLCSEFTTISTDSKLVPAQAGRDDVDQNESEMKWCHVLLEPTCCERLMKELALEMPDRRLSLPKFSMLEKSQKNNDKGIGERPSMLPQEARDVLRKRLVESEGRRHKLRARSVSLVVDGVRRAQLDLATKGQLQIDLEEGANLIEVLAEDDRGSLLVATHFISYVDSAFEFSKGTAILNNGKLEITVIPTANIPDVPQRATLAVNFRPKFDPIRPWAALPLMRVSRQPVWSYALTALLIAGIAWGLTSAFYKHKLALLEHAKEQPGHTQGRQVQTEAQAVVNYLLVPDDEKVRSQERIAISTVSVQSHPQVVILDVPLSRRKESGVYSADLQTFSGNRILMTQNFLRAKDSASHPTVSIIVPAHLLDPDQYYTVQLYSMGSAGRAELINRFTFKVISTE